MPSRAVRAAVSELRPLARVYNRLSRQVARAFSSSTPAQWTAYIIVVAALCLLVAVAVHRGWSPLNPSLRESYASGAGGPKDFTPGQSGNCQRETLPGGTNSDLHKKLGCNQQTASSDELKESQCVPCSVTYPKSVEFEQQVTIKQRAADMAGGSPPATGMANVRLCSDATCESDQKRTFQDVVDEYRDQHLPNELKKVKFNQEQIQDAMQTIGKHVCAFKVYAKNLKASNNAIDFINSIFRKKRNKLAESFNKLNERLPQVVRHPQLVFDAPV